MSDKPWHKSSRWPEGVPFEFEGNYKRPVFSLLDDAAKNYPDAVYTIFQGGMRTYKQVKESADKIANFLAAKGIKHEDRVAMFLPNIPHYPEAFFGASKAGAACVTCNPLYTIEELNFQLKDSDAKAVFCMDHPEFYKTTCEAIKGTNVETVIVCNVKTHLPKIKAILGGLLGKLPKADNVDPKHVRYEDIMAQYPAQAPKVDIDVENDLAVILYTGGTTGVPKGAELKHTNFVYNVMALDQWIRLPNRPGEKPAKMERGGVHTYLGVLPWYHSFGITTCMIGSVYSANRLVCIPDPKAGDPPFTEVLKSCEKYGVTITVAVPTIYTAFVNHPKINDFDLSKFIACCSGAAPLPAEVVRQFEKISGSVIFEGYGLTETTPVLTTNPTFADKRKIGSVGMPLPGTDIKIVDLDTGLKELPNGEDGEISGCGPQIMRGYWKRPDANDEVFREIEGNRYFLTGDIGHIDEDGFIVITDRKKDLILVGGFNAYPKEIEEVLYLHPKVAQAAVVGVPDPRSGEAVKAFVQLKEGVEATEQELKDFCAEHLAGYKRPREIEFRDELPTSVVGKILRRVLRDEEIDKRK